MGSTYGEALLDFDLNFLHPNTVAQNKPDKQRKSILVVKKKIIATDSLIKKYYSKKDELELTDKNLLASREECKQICMDYRKSLDTCSVLENDMLILQNTNKELSEKCFLAENQLAASKSHTHQLQILVKEYETLIESLKIDNKLAESNAKDYEKKFLSAQKQIKTLKNDITLAKDIILRKTKLRNSHKILFQKYDKHKTGKIDDAVFGTASSEEDDFEDAPLSPFYEDENSIKAINCDQVLKSPDTTTGTKPHNAPLISTIKNDKNHDIEYSNDLGSIDTGRGSSLALSDSDKCSHSTDYFINDSPLSDVSISNIRAQTLTVDTATSPIPVYNLVHIATSPIGFDKCRVDSVDIGLNTDNCGYGSSDMFLSNEVTNVDRVEHATSPILMFKTIERAVSPIRTTYTNIATSPVQFDKDDQINGHREIEHSKESLQLNSGINLCAENDYEVEAIFNEMRMSISLISPIPITPVKSTCAHQETPHLETSLPKKYIEQLQTFNCPDAALVREENKKLQASMSQLAKEIDNIKSVLKIPLLSPVSRNEDNGVLDYNPRTECTNLNITHPNRVRTPILEDFNDYERNTTITPEISKMNYTNELEIVENNCPLEMLTESLDLVLSDIDEIESEENDFNGFDNTTESPDSLSKTVEYLQNKDEIIKPFNLRSPIVRCEKLDISRVYNKVNNMEKECQPQNDSRKVTKVRKLTKLSKFKRRILPKYKIKVDHSRSLKRHIKPRKILSSKNKKVITDQDSSATLNDKLVYQKAIEVMAALQVKKKSGASQTILAIKRNKKKENTDVNNKESTVVKIKRNKLGDENNEECIYESSPLLNKSITTRSRSKHKNTQNNINSVSDNDFDQDNISLSELCKRNFEISTNEQILHEPRKRLRSSDDSLEVPSKRLLRSSGNNDQANSADNLMEKKDIHINLEVNNTEISSKTKIIEINKDESCKVTRKSSVAQELDNSTKSKETEKHSSNSIQDNNPKQSILCMMIEKYGVQSVKYSVKKLSDSIIDTIAKKIENEIKTIIELPYNETKDAMNKLVTIIEKWNIKHFIFGLMKYLQDPGRKLELYKTFELPPAPPMTKSEQVLLYIVAQLNNSWPTIDIVDKILSSIEYTLFTLNRTPHFEVIESMSHFYAVVCRYFKLRSRLRLFMLDAMYCIQHKSITLIKQCLDVWMHILPLAHMGIAKNPLVTCLVYLLHFYKCEDRFNKVRDMRIILSRNYFYKFTDWNETQILDMLRNAIKDMKNTKRGNLIEKKMLRIALIILAKRQGTKWCQNNIIKKLLQPIIENHKMQDSVREFCVSLLGPLMKPYPIDMKVHCEVVMNQLFSMLQNNPSPNMTEAIMTSLIYMNRHNQHRVIEAMISWTPVEVSNEFEEIIRGFVRSKPIKAWKTTLSRIPL